MIGTLTRRAASLSRLARSLELGGASGAWHELLARAELSVATGPSHALRRLALDVRHARDEPARQAAAVRDMWAAAADALGADVVDLGDGSLEIGAAGVRTRVHGQTVPLNDEAAVALADDKARLYRVLEAAGVDVPDHRVIDARRPQAAVDFLEQQAPCVLKPVRAAHGWGVTSNLREPRDAVRAARRAARFDNRLLIERQYEGPVLRLLVLEGVVVDAVRRRSPTVRGDGRSTIAELVQAEYERRLRSNRDGRPPSRFDAVNPPFVIDLDCLLTLRRQGLSPRSVPDAGELVTVKTVTNQNAAEDNRTLDVIPDAVAAQAVAAAAAPGLALAGIDLIEQGGGRGVVIDVNARPGLWHHYRVADPGRGTDVAALVLAALLRDRVERAGVE